MKKLLKNAAKLMRIIALATVGLGLVFLFLCFIDWIIGLADELTTASWAFTRLFRGIFGLCSCIITATLIYGLSFVVQNAEEQLQERHPETLIVPEPKPEPQKLAESASADELLKLKGLLDEGVITEEEFAAKKKALLGI